MYLRIMLIKFEAWLLELIFINYPLNLNSTPFSASICVINLRMLHRIANIQKERKGVHTEMKTDNNRQKEKHNNAKK
jgi:hypothetical protein